MDPGKIDVLGKSIYFYTKALLSSFYFISGLNILFDCGEGISLFMREKILKVSDIFITHHHLDHFGGLLGLILSRDSMKGGIDSQLRVYYPKNNHSISLWIRYFYSLKLSLKYEISFIGLNDYEEVFLSPKIFIRSYPVIHDDHCLSYCLFENISKLKSTYRGRNDIHILKNQKAYSLLFNTITKCRLYYSGDVFSFNHNIPVNIDIGIFDSTFLHARDRVFNSHCCLAELLSYLSPRKIRKLLITHISQRYSMENIIEIFIENKLKDDNIFILYDNKFEKITNFLN